MNSSGSSVARRRARVCSNSDARSSLPRSWSSSGRVEPGDGVALLGHILAGWLLVAPADVNEQVATSLLERGVKECRGCYAAAWIVVAL